MKIDWFTGFISILTVLSPAAFSQAQIAPSSTQMRIVTPPFAQSKEPGAIVAALQGIAEFSSDGRHFHAIKQGQLLPPGSVIRTKENGRIDLYLKRTGVALRLQKQTEIHLARLEKTTGAHSSQMIAEVGLTEGSIVALKRGNVPASFEITSSEGLTAAPCLAKGEYLISAHRPGVKSFNLTKPNHLSPALMNEQENANDFGKDPSGIISQLLDFDEMQSFAESWAVDLGSSGGDKNEKPLAQSK